MNEASLQAPTRARILEAHALPRARRGITVAQHAVRGRAPRPPRGPDRRRSPLKPRITLLTLGVDDLERAVAFYRDGLGLPTKGIVGTEFEHGAVAFFERQT